MTAAGRTQRARSSSLAWLTKLPSFSDGSEPALFRDDGTESFAKTLQLVASVIISNLMIGQCLNV